jgi:hypothetical protein
VNAGTTLLFDQLPEEATNVALATPPFTRIIWYGADPVWYANVSAVGAATLPVPPDEPFTLSDTGTVVTSAELAALISAMVVL